jgi:hypothetical protein
MDPEADKKAAEEDKKPKQPEEPPKEKSMQEILAEKDKQIAALQVGVFYIFFFLNLFTRMSGTHTHTHGLWVNE